MSIIQDPMTPNFTFPLLTGTVTENTNGNKTFKCDLETRPCIHPGCTGQLRNIILYHRLTYDCPADPHVAKYPESIHKVLFKKEADAKMNNGFVIHNGKLKKLCRHDMETNMDADELDWDEVKKHVNEPTLLLYDSMMSADVVDCTVCNNWYVICLDCKMPCVIKSICGAFSEEVYNPHTKKYEDGSYIELCRKRVTLMDGTQSEFIGVHHPSEHVKFKSNPPYCIVKPTKEWTNEKSQSNEDSESEEESYDDTDWRYWYECEDKGAIWARDPRLNLFIGQCKYTPILTGTDGGFHILYHCVSCDKEYSFADK